MSCSVSLSPRHGLTTVHEPTGVEYVNIAPNLAYQLVKQGGGEEGHEYEMVRTSHQPPPPAPPDRGSNEIPSPHLSHSQISAVPLPAQPLSSDGGEVPGEAVYEYIGGDM